MILKKGNIYSYLFHSNSTNQQKYNNRKIPDVAP